MSPHRGRLERHLDRHGRPALSARPWSGTTSSSASAWLHRGAAGRARQRHPALVAVLQHRGVLVDVHDVETGVRLVPGCSSGGVTDRQEARRHARDHGGTVGAPSDSGLLAATPAGDALVVRSCGRAVVRSCGRAVVRSCGRAVVRSCGRAEERAGAVARARTRVTSRSVPPVGNPWSASIAVGVTCTQTACSHARSSGRPSTPACPAAYGGRGCTVSLRRNAGPTRPRSPQHPGGARESSRPGHR